MSLTRMLRRHMKKLLVVLVILIAVAFGVSYTMQQVIQSWMAGSWARMFGRTVTPGEFSRTQRRLRGSYRGSEAVPSKEVWEYLAMLEEARRTGITVSNRELKQQILRWYQRQSFLRGLDLIEDEKKKTDELVKYWRLTPQQKKARLSQYDFDREEYQQMIGIRPETSPAERQQKMAEFEDAMREELLLYKLRSFVTAGAIVSPSEVYEEFAKENHGRKIDYLHLSSEDYRDKVEIEEEGLRKFYETCKEEYEYPERITFEYVIARYEDIEAEILKNPPSEKELKRFYEKNRKEFRRSREELSEQEGVTPAKDAYKPYEDVSTQVYKLYLRKEPPKIARERRDKAMEEINALDEITLLKASEIAARLGLRAGETKLFPARDYESELEDEFGFFADATRLFDKVKDFESPSKGKFEAPQSCDKGELAYRISKYVPKHYKPLDEVRQDIEAAYTNHRAGVVARQHAGRILQAAREVKRFTDALIKNEKLVLVTTHFFKNLGNRGEIKTIKNTGHEDEDVIMAAFKLKEIGDFAEPVEVDVAGKPHYYLLRYSDRQEPPPAGFLTKREELTLARRRELETEILKEWKEDLVRRANIIKPLPEREMEEQKKKLPEEKPAEEEITEEKPMAEQPLEEKPAQEQPAREKPAEEKAPEQELPEEKKD